MMKHAKLILCVLVLWSSTAIAQENSEFDGKVSSITIQVSQEVYSPFCPGKTLAMCPSPSASEVRRDIQDMAESGLDKEEIKAKLIEEYGEEFRLVEPPAGDNWGLLALIGFGLLGAGGVVRVMSRRRSGGQDNEEPVEESAEEDSYVKELREQYRD